MKITRIVPAALLAVLAAACGTSPAAQTVVCTEFSVGADLSQTDFGVPQHLEPAYLALAQATSDVSLVAAQLLSDVDGACGELAFELGASSDDPRLAGKLDADRTKALCIIAAERIQAVKARLDAAKVVVRIVETHCSVDAAFQVRCESKCQAEPTCVEATASERCKPEDREGVCAGDCTGACRGTEDAPVTCEATCDGACNGTCDEDEECDGSGCTCKGTCKGACSGVCTAAPGTALACTGRCRGGCSVPVEDSSCAGPLDPPRCTGDADCQQGCEASAAARADCRDGALSIIMSDPTKSDASLARIVQTLERNLPVLFLAARGRAKALADQSSSLTDAAGHLLSHGDELGQKAAACGLLIGKTADQASTNLTAALEGSKKVAAAVTTQ
ncbi:MAG TPA: hypothetical protein VLT33_10020 [Labilithrix sp.]|nr:hypothetical protein [Labilithrix sp.]